MLAGKSALFRDTAAARGTYGFPHLFMKASKSIFTHAAVFAVGIALAMVARQPDADRSENSTSGKTGRSSAGHTAQGSGAAGEAGASASSSREKRELASKSARAHEDPAERLAAINRIGDPLERQNALMDLVGKLAPGDFAAFAEQYRTMEHFANSRGEYELILRSWAKVDPLGALDHASERPDGFGDTTVLLSAWAGSDAAAAERWALDHHKGDGPNPYLSSVIRGIAAYDVNRAAELAASMPNSRERGEAMDAVTRALLVQGAQAAMDYPATVQDPDLRGGYIAMISDRLAAKNPEQAATWLASLDADSQNRGARRIAESLARTDVNQAASWVKKLSPEAQAEAARGVIIPMSTNDIPGTAKWVSTLSGIPNYDRVVEEFVWSCDQRSPEQSAAWIQGISDPAQRTRLYHRMLGDWARRDANAVKNWVANNPVPDSVANRFKK